jgi:hypothetical protein
MRERFFYCTQQLTNKDEGGYDLCENHFPTSYAPSGADNKLNAGGRIKARIK